MVLVEPDGVGRVDQEVADETVRRRPDVFAGRVCEGRHDPAGTTVSLDSLRGERSE